MTTTTRPEERFRHELVLHTGTDALVDLMTPFVQDGAAAGDEILVVGEPEFVDHLLAAVPGVDGIQAIPERSRERFPGRDLHRFQQSLARLDATASSVRVVNQMPTMTEHQWHEWRRYEAAANYVLAPYRVWGTCAYDTDVLDETMLEDLSASHAQLHTPAGTRSSERFADLDDHIAGYLDLPPHPIEATTPHLSLHEPSVHAARRAVQALAAALGLTDEAIQAAMLAVTETVTNGTRHGRGPVEVKAWTEGGQLTVSVTDAGSGPHPLVGLRPVPLDSPSGRGMWILHQLLSDLNHRRHRDGYTVRFSVGGAAPVIPRPVR
ncbi:sensor histidine kinase [Actinotalea sp. C106]|uniref:sensor histidine kinase n=1 Tax=Actinotalea sp. C106 TaxID=2908644 RepID=UPI00202838BD|nr:sensor histidine kinase [Actinotalea sp. C106]